MGAQAAGLSIRIDCHGARFGPGKAALLAAIRDAGSIAAASRALDMSYPRALKLVDEMNQQFATALIAKQHGGARRGGAELTPLGLRVLAAYQAICAQAHDASQATLEDFTAMMQAQ